MDEISDKTDEVTNLSKTTEMKTSVNKWSVDNVCEWLTKINLDEYTNLFKEHKIDGKCLLLLTEDDLRKKPLKIIILGDLKRLYYEIHNLQQSNISIIKTMNMFKFESLKIQRIIQNVLYSSSMSSLSSYRNFNGVNNLQSPNTNNLDDQTNDYEFDNRDSKSSNDDYSCDDILSQDSSSNGRKHLKPEAWKAFISVIYFFIVTWITAIVMVIVHDRVPDMQTYPPLPDIFLDNVPLIPWAFTICELCGLTLFIIWCTILLFHKHRFILLRRFFSLSGSVFLLRCVTMIITSLSVPGRHLQCKARPYGSWQERFHQAYLIWQGGGLSIQGVRTCGDYMFSGHTVALTQLNFFITEYTPSHMYYIHTLSWVLNLFGIFFILAAHEHYSIDVFIAFYISTRLFLYYHTLANNRALAQGDGFRTRIWFPLFYFFESGVDGIVPNIFEMPFVNCVKNLKQKLTKKVRCLAKVTNDYIKLNQSVKTNKDKEI